MMVLDKWGYKSLFHVTDSSYPLILTGKEVWITVENTFHISGGTGDERCILLLN